MSPSKDGFLFPFCIGEVFSLQRHISCGHFEISDAPLYPINAVFFMQGIPQTRTTPKIKTRGNGADLEISTILARLLNKSILSPGVSPTHTPLYNSTHTN